MQSPSIPAALLADCVVPEPLLETNADLEAWADDLYFALRACSETKKKIREILLTK